MAFDTFHPFSRLPCELRHLIWNIAIRPYHDINTFAMHSIATVKSSPKKKCPVILPQLLNTKQIHYIVSAPESNNAKILNRSAYLWDAGLWTACWESREVVSSQLEIKSGGEIRRSLRSESNLAPLREKHMREAGLRLHGSRPTIIPGLLSQDEQAQQSLYLVRPQQDAFKLSPATLLDWTRQFRLLPNWMENFYNYPSSPRSGFRPVRNLAVEFDHRWTRDWPESLGGLLHETSPRGCVATISAASDFYDVDLFIWLIDRGDSEFQEPCVLKQKEAQPYVFYDCDEEYVEIEMRQRSRAESYDRDSALYFINSLDSLACRASDGCYWAVEDLDEGGGPMMFGNVGILKPRKQHNAKDKSGGSYGRSTLSES